MPDKPKEECGIFGIAAPNEPTGRCTAGFLRAFRTPTPRAGSGRDRGERRPHMRLHKKLGLVAQVFDEPTMASLTRVSFYRSYTLQHYRLLYHAERAAVYAGNPQRATGAGS
jgi:glutamine phosphoribosylpyrophosphate amidotransferase